LTPKTAGGSGVTLDTSKIGYNPGGLNLTYGFAVPKYKFK